VKVTLYLKGLNAILSAISTLFFRFQNKIGTGDEQNNVSNKCEFCKTVHSDSHTLSKGVNGFIPVLLTFLKRFE